MPLNADLYVDRIDLARHVDAEMCQVCRVDTLAELVDRLRSGQFCPGQCPHWPRARVEAFQWALDAGEALPTIPSLNVPRPTDTGWFDLNGATADSPALITGNSALTHEVLLAVLSTISGPMWMVSVDTGGHTVDMSLVYRELTPQSIVGVLRDDGLQRQEFTGRIILPGLAEALVLPVSRLLNRTVEVGPVCAAELPLFLASNRVG